MLHTYGLSSEHTNHTSRTNEHDFGYRHMGEVAQCIPKFIRVGGDGFDCLEPVKSCSTPVSARRSGSGEWFSPKAIPC